MDNRNTCSIEGCERVHKARTFCASHYRQWRVYGDPLGGYKRTFCVIDGCGVLQIAKGYCRRHYTRNYRNGSPLDEDQAWVWGERDKCACCLTPLPAGSTVRYCKEACASSFSQYGARPANRPCAQCGEIMDFSVRTETGRLRKRESLICGRCLPTPHLRNHVPDLIARDGGDCGICGEEIDLALKFPHPKSRSVDHVIPRSRGGRNELGNYQLSHLGCNATKKDQIGFTLTP